MHTTGPLGLLSQSRGRGQQPAGDGNSSGKVGHIVTLCRIYIMAFGPLWSLTGVDHFVAAAVGCLPIRDLASTKAALLATKIIGVFDHAFAEKFSESWEEVGRPMAEKPERCAIQV